jgi:hypothetical protein
VAPKTRANGPANREGILNITDQILIAVDQDDSIDTSDGLLERIPVSLAKQEMAAQAESS